MALLEYGMTFTDKRGNVAHHGIHAVGGVPPIYCYSRTGLDGRRGCLAWNDKDPLATHYVAEIWQDAANCKAAYAEVRNRTVKNWRRDARAFVGRICLAPMYAAGLPDAVNGTGYAVNDIIARFMADRVFHEADALIDKYEGGSGTHLRSRT